MLATVRSDLSEDFQTTIVSEMWCLRVDWKMDLLGSRLPLAIIGELQSVFVSLLDDV